MSLLLRFLHTRTRLQLIFASALTLLAAFFLPLTFALVSGTGLSGAALLIAAYLILGAVLLALSDSLDRFQLLRLAGFSALLPFLVVGLFFALPAASIILAFCLTALAALLLATAFLLAVL